MDVRAFGSRTSVQRTLFSYAPSDGVKVFGLGRPPGYPPGHSRDIPPKNFMFRRPFPSLLVSEDFWMLLSFLSGRNFMHPPACATITAIAGNGTAPTTPDPNTPAKDCDTNGGRVVIQIGVCVQTTFYQEEGVLLQKYCGRKGRCIAILFKVSGSGVDLTLQNFPTKKSPTIRDHSSHILWKTLRCCSCQQKPSEKEDGSLRIGPAFGTAWIFSLETAAACLSSATGDRKKGVPFIPAQGPLLLHNQSLSLANLEVQVLREPHHLEKGMEKGMEKGRYDHTASSVAGKESEEVPQTLRLQEPSRRCPEVPWTSTEVPGPPKKRLTPPQLGSLTPSGDLCREPLPEGRIGSAKTEPVQF